MGCLGFVTVLMVDALCITRAVTAPALLLHLCRYRVAAGIHLPPKGCLLTFNISSFVGTDTGCEFLQFLCAFVFE